MTHRSARFANRPRIHRDGLSPGLPLPAVQRDPLTTWLPRFVRWSIRLGISVGSWRPFDVERHDDVRRAGLDHPAEPLEVRLARSRCGARHRRQRHAQLARTSLAGSA